MSENSKSFIRDYLPGQTQDDEAKTPDNSVQKFQLESFSTPGKTRHKGFVHDSEISRNLDPANVLAAKQGVREIMKDALEKAKIQAKEIKERAEKEGREAGYADGFEKGEQAAKEKFTPMAKSFEQCLKELSELRKNLYSKVEREMVEMVVALAKKIIQFELSTQPDSIKKMIQLAVQSVLDKQFMVIKINPEDKEPAESFCPELKHLYPEIQHIAIEPQSGIARGGCLIETNFGSVDARIEKLEEQLEKILHLAPQVPEDESTDKP